MRDPGATTGDSDPTSALAAAVGTAVARLGRAGLVAYPTETVWGLAADSCSADAVAALERWKGRPPGQPIAVMISAPELLAGIAGELPHAAGVLASRFWPGPLTLVVPLRGAAEGRFAPGIVSATGGLGVRCSPHPVAREFARAAAEAGLGPPTATSLNRSGETPARDRVRARAVCGASGGPWLLDAGEDAYGAQPSSVVDLCGPQPRLLREGALGARALSDALGVPLDAPAPERRV